MGMVFESLEPQLTEWIESQKLFFVSTAPLDREGLINCSPKGLDSFRVLDDHTVAYLDLTGSGVETIAHLKENQRITLMFCAFDGPPKILRLYGEGEVLEKGSPGFEQMKDLFPRYTGVRTIIRVSVNRIADSCGFGVPKYNFESDRNALIKWADNKGEAGIEEYVGTKNHVSLDGLPGITS